MELREEDGVEARFFGYLGFGDQFAEKVVETLTNALDRKNNPILHLLVSDYRGLKQLCQLELAEPGASRVDFFSQDSQLFFGGSMRSRDLSIGHQYLKACGLLDLADGHPRMQ